MKAFWHNVDPMTCSDEKVVFKVIEIPFPIYFLYSEYGGMELRNKFIAIIKGVTYW